MKKILILLNLILVGFCTFSQTENVITQQEVIPAVQKQEKFFIENKGQWPAEVLFLCDLSGQATWITESGIVFDFYRIMKTEGKMEDIDTLTLNRENQYDREGDVVHMEMLGSNPRGKCQIQSIDRQYTNYNYFLDKDHQASRVGLFKEVLIENVYEGIDIRYYLDKGAFRYDFILKPGANPDLIKLKYHNAKEIRVDENGSLLLETKIGIIKFQDLYAYQELLNHTRVDVNYWVNENTVGFEVDDYDTSRSLVIDPLVYSTFFSSSGLNSEVRSVFKKNDFIYVQGKMLSSTFPGTIGYYIGTPNIYDYLCKFSQNLDSLLFATFHSIVNSKVFLSDSMLLITGLAVNANFFATANAFQPNYNGYLDVGIARLSVEGDSLIAATFLGGASQDQGFDIGVDKHNYIYVTGETVSTNFPVTNGALDNTLNFIEGFICKLSPNLDSLIYSTFIGGTNMDGCKALIVKKENVCILAGTTASSNFPTTSNGYDYYCGNTDFFVCQITGNHTLNYSTYHGGSQEEVFGAMTLDLDSNIIIVGSTKSWNIPTTLNALYQYPQSYLYAGIITTFDSTLTTIIASTYFGDDSYGLAITDVETGLEGNIFLCGSIVYPLEGYELNPNSSSQFPSGGIDAYIAILNPELTTIEYFTFLGGQSRETGMSIVNDTELTAIISGSTESSGFPVTSNAFQSLPAYVNVEGFISRLYLPFTSNIITHPTCPGYNDGSIVITFTGGDAPYQILWDNGDTTSTLSGLSAGNYSVTITDAMNRENIQHIEILNPPQINLDFVVDSIFFVGIEDGAIDLTISQGTSPFQFLWSTGDTTEDISNLTEDIYHVTVTDFNGCTQTDSVEVPFAYVGLSITESSIYQITCSYLQNGAIDVDVTGSYIPYAYQWSTGETTQDISNLNSGTYYLTVLDVLGDSIVQSFIIGAAPQELMGIPSFDSPICHGELEYVSFTATGGTPPYFGLGTAPFHGGYYSRVISDANACLDTVFFEIQEYPPLYFDISSSGIQCNGDKAEIIINANGGTQPISGTGIFNVYAGSHQFELIDMLGCSIDTTLLITEPPAILVQAVVSDETGSGASNGAIQLTISGGTPGYAILWNHGETTEDISGLSAGTYLVTITDSNNCEESREFEVELGISVSEVREFAHDMKVFPNPVEELFTIQFNLSEAHAIKLTITNMLGESIYSSDYHLFNPGENQIQVNMNEFSSGFYTAILYSEGYNIRINFEKLH